MTLGFELARTNTALGGATLAHTRRLVASWQVLADLCFADLLFLAAIEGEEGHRFVVLGQVRPTTDQTLYTDDMVGTVVGEVDRPLIKRVWREGEIAEGETKALGSTERARIKCIPVRCEGTLIGLVTRETPLTSGRRAGSLERQYFEVFDRLARMIAEGSFPFPRDEVEFEDAPRVADGVIILNGDAQIRFASPNAISSLHRMGIHAYTSGQRLAEIGFDQDAVDAALAARLPVTEEIERGDTSILIRAIPLLDTGDAVGALVLMRDVTDLRRRDRHAALEGRHHPRDPPPGEEQPADDRGAATPPGTAARIGGGAGGDRGVGAPHPVDRHRARDALARRRGRRAVRRRREAARADGRGNRLDARRRPCVSRLPAMRAICGAMSPPRSRWCSTSSCRTQSTTRSRGTVPARPKGACSCGWPRLGSELVVEVIDDGVGLPPGFTVESSKGLGLSIVQALVNGELGGSMELGPSTRDTGGTHVSLRVPLAPQRAG